MIERMGRAWLIIVMGCTILGCIAAAGWWFYAKRLASRPRTAAELIAQLRGERSGFLPIFGRDEADPVTVRRQACLALGKLKSDAAIAAPVLLDIARRDPSETVRVAALEALAAFGPSADAVLSDLLQMFRNSSDVFAGRTLIEAIPQIARGDPKTIDTLTELLASSNRRLSAGAAVMLSDLGEFPEVPETMLLDLLKKYPKFRDHFIRALGRRSQPGKQVIKAIESVIFDHDISIRIMALEALGNLGPSAGEAVPTIGRLVDESRTNIISAQELLTIYRLENRSNEAYRVALRTLGRIGPSAASAIPALTSVCENTNSAVRFYATLSRLQIDGNCPGALKIFTDGIRNEDPNIQSIAVERFKEAASLCEESVNLVNEMLRSTNRSLRLAALEVVPKLGTNAIAVTDALKEATTANNRTVRAMAERTLAEVEKIRVELKSSTAR